ncbi:MAG: hypothetical protein M1837_003762 [Sclerophora amabilis]|nr:MAG: hypothetical protein M1837_003762 [Sclerophora amabilis]
MGPSNMYFSSAAPTLVLSPQNIPEPFANDTTSSRFLNPSPCGKSSDPALSHWLSAKSNHVVNPSRGRKRSCNEMISHSETGDGFNRASSTDAVSLAPAKPEPVYGEGMALIQPSGFIIDAGSQTGTWAEEKEESESQAQATASPPIDIISSNLQSRKAQRVDHPPDASSSAPLVPLSVSPAKSHPAEPTVDEFTLRLGIGWTRLDSSPAHMEDAVRGWARYIDNHYPLTNPTLMLQSKAHNSFLVGSQEGFFLFDENLGEGRLVGRTEETMLSNLRNVPVVFEGDEVIRAVGTPSAMTALTVPGGNDLLQEPLMGDTAPATTITHEHANAGHEVSMQLD